MMTIETTTDLSFGERLRRLAETTPPDKATPSIRKIIEVRRFISEQKLRGHSWPSLKGMLAKEGLNLTAGTLRNYMAQIGHAEEYLHVSGNSEPSDSEIHAALRQKKTGPQSPPVKPPQNVASPARPGPARAPLSTTIIPDPYDDL